jgi:hypothetical protein
MKNRKLMTGIVLCLICTKLHSQYNLDWLSSFSPIWSNGSLSGSANNVNGSSINCNTTVTLNGGGVFVPALGSSGAITPTVSGAVFTVPGATNRLQVTPNYTNNSSYTNIVLSFSSQVTNVTFRIVDIDKANATSTTYYDRVTVTGTDGSSTFNPTITKYDATTDPNFLVISGNTASVNTTSGQSGNCASDASDQRGTVTVNFGSVTINSVTIRYDNAPGANANPAAQSIAVGQVSFQQSTLPVTLTDFNGHWQANDVILNWSTSHEFNSSVFEIERSKGDNNWGKIGTVTAAGFSNNARNYSFRDVNPPGSQLFYRLKQVDIDNNFKYSTIVRISRKTFEAGINVYPNPFQDKVNITLHSRSVQTITLTLTDITGKVVRTETKKVFIGENNILLGELEKASKGIYIITVRDDNGEIIGVQKISR